MKLLLMSEVSSNPGAVDSWEDFDDEDDVVFQKLNEAIEKIQISGPRDVDPFEKAKSSESSKKSQLPESKSNDPEVQQLTLENVLLSTKSNIRPATNMSLIRNVVSRHLNIRPTDSPKEQEEKEQLKRAREAKKAKDSYWKQ